jgi:predicted anti-sigma-YlaC factor YlaD
VSCEQYREALSARLDGEDEGPAGQRLAGHLASCPGCAEWYASAQRVTRLVRVAPAEPVPDLSAAVLAAAGPARRRLRSGELLLRAALGAVALAQLVLAGPSLLGHDAVMQSMHGAHEYGTWNAALAVALGWVAARPRHAAGLLPLLTAFSVGLLVASVADLADGSVPVGRVATHLLIGVGLGLVAALTWVRRAPRPLDGQGGRRRSGRPQSWIQSWAQLRAQSLARSPAGSALRPRPACGQRQRTNQDTAA